MKTVIKNKIKNIFIVAMLIIFQQSYSQQIVNISTEIEENGKYYKDLFGMLDNYVGTWVYANGNEYFKVIIRKDIKFHNNFLGSNYYIDGIVGEYQYKDVDGVELINTLANLNLSSIGFYSYNISGNSLMRHNQLPYCDDCDPLINRIRINFSDPLRPYLMCASGLYIAIKDGAPNKMILKVSTGGVYIPPTPNSPDQFNVPDGVYLLTKI